MLLMRNAARSIGIFLAILATPLALLAVTTPVSNVGLAYVIGSAIVIVGMLTAPKRVSRMKGVVRAGLGLIALTVLFRLAFAGHGKTITMICGQGGTPLLDRLLPESDVATTSARAVIIAGVLPSNDTKSLVPTLRASFLRMDEEEGSTPSPIVRTMLKLQTKATYDVIEIPAALPHATDAVLFLHGYGGNFTLQCWAIAKASKLANATTFCPSTRLSGDWWQADGPAIVTDMLAKLRARGFERIVLAGLSNGGIGASRLTASYKKNIVGLLLVSGADPDAEPSGVPTIAFQGSRDGMMPPSHVRSYAEKTGATYVELDGTHFLLLEKLDEMTNAMGEWLLQRFTAR
ncbi:MAG: alpha/beta hydrolase [Polyangiaceae bacterium]